MNAQNENLALTMDAASEFDTEPFDCKGFDEELFLRDPVFTKAFQTNLSRMAADMDAGRNTVYHDIIEIRP